MNNRPDKKINPGVEEINRGVGKINRGVESINRGGRKINRGVGKINRPVESINRGLGKINRGVSDDTSVTVTSPSTEEVQWELIHDGFKPVEVGDSTFQFWPVDEAPAWALRALEEISAREATRIKERGPYIPVRDALAYGEVPTGYREDLAGKYTVIIFAEQGNARAFFEVFAA